MPEMEAWYCFANHSEITEAAWANGQRSGTYPFRKDWLKQQAYGTNRPGLDHALRCASEAAKRLMTDLEALDIDFPMGFGALATDLRSWIDQG